MALKGAVAALIITLFIIHGYYGFRFVTLPPPQCVERFHCYSSNEKNIASLLKFAEYIHNHKVLPGNIFGLIFKNKMAAMGVSLSVMKSAYISLIIGPIGLEWKTNPLEIMGWESFGVVGFDLGPLLQGQMSIAKLKSAYNSLIIGLQVWDGKPT